MELVTIENFSDTFEANIVRAKLEEQGIECFIQNENVVNIAWLSSDAVGGLKLKVREEDYERALEIINSGLDLDNADEFVDDEPEANGNVRVCPECHSKALIETVYPKLLGFILSAVGFTQAKTWSKKFYCTNCGKKWKE